MAKPLSVVVVVCCVLYSSVCYEVNCKKHDHHTRSENSTDDGKIVGGYSTTIQKVPYQVYMLVKKGNDYYQCGGSIISKRWVLTAAHCLTGVSQVNIRAGSTNSESGGKTYTTTTYKQHPQYNAKTSDYDVAVVQLNQDMPLDGTTMKAVRLAAVGSTVVPRTQLLVTGWGTTSENGKVSKNLMAVKVPTVSNTECRTSYGNTITNRMFCAGLPQGGKDSCQGDSGGPAVNDRTGVQLGVVSFGQGCARPRYPGVYTNIAAVRTWIKQNTGV